MLTANAIIKTVIIENINITLLLLRVQSYHFLPKFSYICKENIALISMDSLTNNTRKIYASLGTAKGRRTTGLFMAQGTKCVLDTYGHFQCQCVLATSQWIESHPTVPALAVKGVDLERISTLSTPPQVVAIYHIPEDDGAEYNDQELCLALD